MEKKFTNKKLYLKNTPFALRNNVQFVCWKMVYDETRDKFLKLPFNPKNGKHASSTNPATWTNFYDACDAVEKYNFDGIGIMFAKGLIGIDLDNHINEYGELSEEAADIIKTVSSYTELSPSGKGIHILAFADLPENHINKISSKGFEIYSEKRFFTLTGEPVKNIFYKLKSKKEATNSVNTIYEKYFVSEKQKNKDKNSSVSIDKIDINSSEIGSQKLSDKVIIYKMIKDSQKAYERNGNKNFTEELLLRGDWKLFYNDQSTAEFAIARKIAFYSDSNIQVKRIMVDSPLYRDKWERIIANESYIDKLIKDARATLTSQYKKKTDLILQS